MTEAESGGYELSSSILSFKLALVDGPSASMGAN